MEKEIGNKKLLPESQNGFRRGRGIMENIFILSHLIQREKRKKKENKVYAVFIDLKAAFDKVDRGLLWDTLEEKGVDKELIKRIKKIYEDTRQGSEQRMGYQERSVQEKVLGRGMF